MTSSPSDGGGDHCATMPQNPPPSTAAGTATGRQGEREGVETTVENGEEHPGTLGGGGVGTGAGGSTYRSGNDQAKAVDDEIPSVGRTSKRPGALNGGNDGGRGGSGRGESNPVEAGGGGGRGGKGRWVTTMMVPGRKLWDSSPAMMSQYKRFRRSRQDPKIARDQVHDTCTTSVSVLFGTRRICWYHVQHPVRFRCIIPRRSPLQFSLFQNPTAKFRVLGRWTCATCATHQRPEREDMARYHSLKSARVCYISNRGEHGHEVGPIYRELPITYVFVGVHTQTPCWIKL